MFSALGGKSFTLRSQFNMPNIQLNITTLLCTLVAMWSAVADAQVDPLSQPSSTTASPGSYQYGIGLLKLDKAWALTRGRTSIALIDVGFTVHPDLASGIDGNLRSHLSSSLFSQPGMHHGLAVAGVMAARGGNGIGIQGACNQCSLIYQTGVSPTSFQQALRYGAVAINLSTGAISSQNLSGCATRDLDCKATVRTALRDVVMVGIAQNEANLNGTIKDAVFSPADHPAFITVSGVEPGAQFWTTAFYKYEDGTKFSSSWGPKVRLVAPAKSVLTTQLDNKYLYDFKPYRCGDRVDSEVGEERTLPERYAGYGTCNGNSFAAPWVTGIVGLMRSANPLLTAPEVHAILFETAQSQPVAGPDGLTFYMPDAYAAVQRALGSDNGASNNNRLTPMFSLYAANSSKHLFTSTPQVAVAGIAGELVSTNFQSVGQRLANYPKFTGRICDTNNANCKQPEAAAAFQVFTTENAPAGTALVPLYRFRERSGRLGFSTVTNITEGRQLEQNEWNLDMIEGYVYSPTAPQPSGTVRLCKATDATRNDELLYAASSVANSTAPCNRTTDYNGTGNYLNAVTIGYVHPLAQEEPVQLESGWWWNQNEPGRGFFIERNEDRAFLSGYLYADSGAATWFAAEGKLNKANNTLTASMTTFADGQTLGGTNRAPRATGSLGALTMQFKDASNATLTWPGGRAEITRYQFAQGASAAYIDTGWWWNPSQSGTGFSVEVQGDTVFIAGFLYEASGAPIWYTAVGKLKDNRVVNTTLNTFRNGQPLTGAHRLPTSTELGAVEFAINEPTKATLKLSDGRVIELSRFRF
jgi:serine protease